MKKTVVKVYRNKRNANKFIEVHSDGHYHNLVKQYLEWNNGVKYVTGDRCLHRWTKKNLNELLEDYELIVDAVS